MQRETNRLPGFYWVQPPSGNPEIMWWGSLNPFTDHPCWRTIRPGNGWGTNGMVVLSGPLGMPNTIADPDATPPAELIERLWSSDAASALTNQAAREIERLRAVIAAIADEFGYSVEALEGIANHDQT